MGQSTRGERLGGGQAEPAPARPEQLKVVYDGDSLPMIEFGRELLRLQVLHDGRWINVDSAAVYAAVLRGQQ